MPEFKSGVPVRADAKPDDVSLLCRRAAELIAQRKFDQAEADLRRAAKLDDASADVQLNLGILHCRRARWREAIEPLELAVELDPSRVAGHYFLAEAYNQTDRHEDALAQYETVVHLEPDNWRALKGVGIVLDKMGRPAEATQAYKRAREAQRR
jgi:tetratricopeptide (TPR) repeat protein